MLVLAAVETGVVVTDADVELEELVASCVSASDDICLIIEEDDDVLKVGSIKFPEAGGK